jgi:copper chaperone
MLEFKIPAISCGHCARAVTEAVRELDARAEVKVDIAGKQVQVSTEVPRAAVAAALVEAGYAPSNA